MCQTSWSVCDYIHAATKSLDLILSTVFKYRFCRSWCGKPMSEKITSSPHKKKIAGKNQSKSKTQQASEECSTTQRGELVLLFVVRTAKTTWSGVALVNDGFTLWACQMLMKSTNVTNACRNVVRHNNHIDCRLFNKCYKHVR